MKDIMGLEHLRTPDISPKDGTIQALEYRMETVGGKLKETKAKHIWKVRIQDGVYNIEFWDSRISGKKKLAINGTVVLQQVVGYLQTFTHTWVIASHILSIAPDKKNSYILTIDGFNFGHYRKEILPPVFRKDVIPVMNSFNKSAESTKDDLEFPMASAPPIAQISDSLVPSKKNKKEVPLPSKKSSGEEKKPSSKRTNKPLRNIAAPATEPASGPPIQMLGALDLLNFEPPVQPTPKSSNETPTAFADTSPDLFAANLFGDENMRYDNIDGFAEANIRSLPAADGDTPIFESSLEDILGLGSNHKAKAEPDWNMEFPDFKDERTTTIDDAFFVSITS